MEKYCCILSNVIIFISITLMLGCEHEEFMKARVKSELPSGSIAGSFTVSSGKNSGKFTDTHTTASLECEIVVLGQDRQGTPFQKVISIKVTAKGAPGGMYELACDDPVIVQLPVDAINFRGLLDDFTNQQDLVIESGLTSIPIGPNDFLIAESGNQFVIISYPDNLSDGFYSFSIDFDLDNSRNIFVKPLITAKVVMDGKTYYPPIIPCVSSLADVPLFEVPVSDQEVDFIPMIEDIGDCEVVLDFTQTNIDNFLVY